MSSSSATSSDGRQRPFRGLIFGLAFVVLLVGGSLWIFRTTQQVAAQWEITRPNFEPAGESEPISAVIEGQEGDSIVPAAARGGEAAPIISAEALQPWPGRQRVTILFLGIDKRCDEDGPTRTDSLMVVSVDPVARTASLLSLPRDLWVEIPDFGVDRINQAHYVGEVFSYPGGGGPALAVETIAATLGIPVDYYVTINFDAFIEVVDQIGGIDIEVPERIDDPTYPDNCYGYNPFRIDAGRHHLDGEQALKYARTRATFGGDVDRATRQQQVVLAVRDKVTRLGMIPQLVTQSPDLWLTLQKNVRTNLSLDEAVQLALLAQDIPRENIHAAVIDYQYVYEQTTPSGQQVLIPIRNNIRTLRDELFAPSPLPTPSVDDLPEKMRRENARVALHNGTPVFGLAKETQDYLLSFGVNVTEIGNADSSTFRTTRIIDYGQHPDTTLYLTQLLSIPPLNIVYESAPDAAYDVLIILGNDWEIPAQ